MAADRTLYGVALLFALWALQKAVEGLFKFRQTMRARYLDTTQLLDDIKTNLEAAKEMASAFDTELNGAPSPLEARMIADKDYYVFSVTREVTLELFQSDAVQRYSHLDSELFNKIKLFYDLQKIIAATSAALMTENFKALSTGRKLTTVRRLSADLKKSIVVGQACQQPLRDEIAALHDAVLWKVLFLDSRRSKNLKERSGGAAT